MNSSHSENQHLPDSALNSESRVIDLLLSKYAESHRNPTNEKIHFICVPVIVWTVLGLLWAIHPALAIGSAIATIIYYAILSVPFAIGMSLMSSIMLAILVSMPVSWVLPIAGIAFIIAWCFQFIGHKIEGKKPSFLEDIRFLLIGPLFVLSFAYRRFKIHY